MPVRKGQPWGAPAPLPDDGVVVTTDGEVRSIVEEARHHGGAIPVFGLLGGDLCRTLGGTGDPGRLRSEEAMTFPVDAGAVIADGRLHWFVAHLVARSRLWRRAFVVMNAQWYGAWNLGPRAHPGDGLLDSYDARVPVKDLWKIRARLRHGTHLPHPGIKERRITAIQVSFDRSLPLELDGVAVGRARNLSVRVEPDAFRVVV
jgi:hypothetical protein